MDVKNSGTRPVILGFVTVNEVPVDEYDIQPGEALTDTANTGTSIPSTGLYLESGESATVYLWIGSDLLSSGTSVSIRLQGSSGIGYIKLVKLA